MSVLLLAYPLLIFIAVRWQLPWLGMAALLGFGVHFLWPALRAARRWAWVMLSVIACAGLWVGVSGDSRALVQMMPVLVFLMLAIFFARTLLGGVQPLVTRIAAAARDIPLDRIDADMPAALRNYTRRVTQFWTLMFVLFAIEDLLMLWLTPPMPWPYVVNLANFALLALIMVGEYLYHSRRFPNPKHNNFMDFVRDVARFDYHSLLDD